MGKFHCSLYIYKLLILTILHTISLSQAQAPQNSPNQCNEILVTYTYVSGYPVPPMVPSNLTQQAYRFQSTLTVLNNGLQELPSWRVFVGFKHNELLVSASNAVLADGTSLPANVSTGAVLAGFPVTNLRTGIQTAGDFNLMLARVELVGTQFGVGAPDIPLPGSLRIANDGFSCTSPSVQG